VIPLLFEEHWNRGGRPVSYSHIFIIRNTKKQLSNYVLAIITDDLLTHYSVPDEKLSDFCRLVSFFIPVFPTTPEKVSTCHQVCSYGIHFPSITNTNHLL